MTRHPQAHVPHRWRVRHPDCCLSSDYQRDCRCWNGSAQSWPASPVVAKFFPLETLAIRPARTCLNLPTAFCPGPPLSYYQSFVTRHAMDRSAAQSSACPKTQNARHCRPELIDCGDKQESAGAVATHGLAIFSEAFGHFRDGLKRLPHCLVDSET